MPQSSRGFTLVEVIVALGIFSLIMLATVSGYRTLGNTASTIDRMTDRTDELRSVSAFLRDALENAVVGTESGGGDEMTFGGTVSDAGPVTFFKVTEGGLEWRAKILFGEAYGGSYFLRLARQQDELCFNGRNPRVNLSQAVGRMLLQEQYWITFRLLRSGPEWMLSRSGFKQIFNVRHPVT